MTTHLIAGTAGHIDHGKTLLVQALTGINADRLPDEKRRGMTIDLGFAALQLGDFRLGIVDVPGHERFIRNMLCGAMAIDVAMLVIAASESIKPQTREHLDILELLGIEHGVVVLTKCDLVEPSWIDLVEQEVQELMAGTRLSDAPVVRVSSLSGQGLPQLREQLAITAQQASLSPRQQLADAPFRMAVDRAFSAPGHGTILTGSIGSGRISVGEEVALEPPGITARVRGIESHGTAVESAGRGQRAAINLVGVDLAQVRRGNVLAAPGYLAASRRLHIHWTVTPDQRPRLQRSGSKRRIPVRVHLGTAEIQADLRLLELPEESGEAVLAQLDLAQPVACVWGEPIVLRSQSPAVTLGGGLVIDPEARAVGRRHAEALPHLTRLATGSEQARAAALCYLNGTDGLDAAQVLRRTGGIGPREHLWEPLIAAGQVIRFDLGGGRLQMVHGEVVEQWMRRVEQLLTKQHARNPLQAVFPSSTLLKIFSENSSRLCDAVLRRMENAGRLEIAPAGVALPGQGPQLSKPQRRLYTEIIEAHRNAGCAPPTSEELAASTDSRRSAVPKLVELGVAQGHLVRICADWCLHAEVESQVLQTLTRQLGSRPFAVRDLRELLHVSRKYLVPLCEYLDRIGFTHREGNLRTILGAPSRMSEEVSS